MRWAWIIAVMFAVLAVGSFMLGQMKYPAPKGVSGQTSMASRAPASLPTQIVPDMPPQVPVASRQADAAARTPATALPQLPAMPSAQASAAPQPAAVAPELPVIEKPASATPDSVSAARAMPPDTLPASQMMTRRARSVARAAESVGAELPTLGSALPDMARARASIARETPMLGNSGRFGAPRATASVLPQAPVLNGMTAPPVVASGLPQPQVMRGQITLGRTAAASALPQPPLLNNQATVASAAAALPASPALSTASA